MTEVRLIDANALHAKILEENRCNYAATENVAQILLRIETAPTIEPEVRHGRWNYRHDDDWCYCTACGADAEGDCGEPLETLYCPNCGADMREVSEDAGTD